MLYIKEFLILDPLFKIPPGFFFPLVPSTLPFPYYSCYIVPIWRQILYMYSWDAIFWKRYINLYRNCTITGKMKNVWKFKSFECNLHLLFFDSIEMDLSKSHLHLVSVIRFSIFFYIFGSFLWFFLLNIKFYACTNLKKPNIL